MKTVSIEVTQPFIYERRTTEVGEIIQVPRAFAFDMVNAQRAVFVSMKPAPPPTGSEAPSAEQQQAGGKPNKASK